MGQPTSHFNVMCGLVSCSVHVQFTVWNCTVSATKILTEPLCTPTFFRTLGDTLAHNFAELESKTFTVKFQSGQARRALITQRGPSSLSTTANWFGNFNPQNLFQNSASKSCSSPLISCRTATNRTTETSLFLPNLHTIKMIFICLKRASSAKASNLADPEIVILEGDRFRYRCIGYEASRRDC